MLAIKQITSSGNFFKTETFSRNAGARNVESGQHQQTMNLMPRSLIANMGSEHKLERGLLFLNSVFSSPLFDAYEVVVMIPPEHTPSDPSQPNQPNRPPEHTPPDGPQELPEREPPEVPPIDPPQEVPPITPPPGVPGNEPTAM